MGNQPLRKFFKAQHVFLISFLTGPRPALLRASQLASMFGRGRSVAASSEGKGMMNDKLSILVRVDLDGAQALVSAQGHVTAQSIQALYVVVKRANDLMKGLALEIDVTRARVDPSAL